MRGSRYRELGLRPVINAAATLTTLGGSRLAPPAVAAMAEAAEDFVDLPELQRRVGERLAELTGNEAGYVTCGAAAGITLAVASCITGAKPARLEVFPGPVGAHRVAMFHGHRNSYDYAARLFGASVVEFDATLASMRHAVEPPTAAVLWFAGGHYAAGAPELAELIELARERDVPVLVDAAAQVPPISSLWDFTIGAGADAVIISGGKGLRGPQSSGMVLGRSSIIDGCRAHGAPRHGVGRGMKVGKEELLGLLAAVQWSLGRDEAAVLSQYERSVTSWLDGLRGLAGVRVERGYPSEAGQPHSRALLWVGPDSGWTTSALVEALWDGDPRIAVLMVGEAIALNPQTLDPGEDMLVLEALRSLLSPGLR